MVNKLRLQRAKNFNKFLNLHAVLRQQWIETLESVRNHLSGKRGQGLYARPVRISNKLSFVEKLTTLLVAEGGIHINRIHKISLQNWILENRQRYTIAGF